MQTIEMVASADSPLQTNAASSSIQSTLGFTVGSDSAWGQMQGAQTQMDEREQLQKEPTASKPPRSRRSTVDEVKVGEASSTGDDLTGEEGGLDEESGEELAKIKAKQQSRMQRMFKKMPNAAQSKKSFSIAAPPADVSPKSSQASLSDVFAAQGPRSYASESRLKIGRSQSSVPDFAQMQAPALKTSKSLNAQDAPSEDSN